LILFYKQLTYNIMVKVKKKKTAMKRKKLKAFKPAKRRKVLNKKKVKKVVAKKAAKKIAKPKKIISGKIKRIVPHKPKKHTAKIPASGFPAESLFKAKIKVIGIGGGGGSIVSEIGRSLKKATFVIADTDIRALKKKSGIKYLWFGGDLTHGLGTGVNVELAKQAAESAKGKINSIFEDQDIIIFVASLGGGLGSGATQVFVEAAREFGGITLGIFTMPFKFEGKNKHRIAQNALKSLRKSLNVSLVIPNEKIFKIIDETTPITNAFSTVNKSLIESLESLIDLISNPGIINIDFADLRTILRGRGNSAFLNTIEESGKARVERICENIFKNPLLQNNGFEAEKILFNIAGAENLSMFEVEKISSHIGKLNPKAKIIFGISKDSSLKNKIKTTILMTGASPGAKIEEEIFKEVPAEKIEPKKIAVQEQAEKSEIGQNKFQNANIRKPKKIKNPKNKKTPEKPANKSEKPKGHSGHPKTQKPASKGGKEEKPVSFIPVFEVPAPAIPILDQKKMEVNQAVPELGKKTIRRSGLEIKKAEELQEKKRLAQEKEWEIPAFLRKVKFRG